MSCSSHETAVGKSFASSSVACPLSLVEFLLERVCLVAIPTLLICSSALLEPERVRADTMLHRLDWMAQITTYCMHTLACASHARPVSAG